MIDISITDLASGPMGSIRDVITDVSYSWTLDSVSEVSFGVWDQDLRMINNNYFQVRRGVLVAGQRFEIASVEVSQGQGTSPQVRVRARREAVQLMKRDKNPSAYGGGTATDYARAVAGAFGLNFAGQNTGTQAVQVQAAQGGKADSVWDVLKRNAGEAQFVVFESDNTLYFASEEWLLGKWANLNFNWPNFDPADPFPLYQIPNCVTSEDNPNAAEIKFIVERTNGVNVRPGMTVNFTSFIIPFNGPYLVSEVSYDETPKQPVSVSVRTPVKPEPKQQ
jgi:hypothetical protein